MRRALPLAIAGMSWIRVLDMPSCYECGTIMWVERKLVRPLASLVRTVQPCAQRHSASAHVDERLASHGNHSFCTCYISQDFFSEVELNLGRCCKQTSDLFDEVSFWNLKNSKWPASLLTCLWIYPCFSIRRSANWGQVLLAITHKSLKV